MNEQSPAYDSFVPLLNAACDGMLNDEQFYELIAALDSDVALCKLFASHIQLLTDMQLLGRAEKACNSSLTRVRATLDQPPPSYSPSPTPYIFSTALRSSLTCLTSDWPVAYLIAAAIFAIGAIVGSFVYVSSPTDIALDNGVHVDSTPERKSEIVAHITGMVDCKWAGTKRVAREVTPGTNYKLASGLVEITYNTGAKVILQGPVTYTVDSHNGGYLSAGRLTARVEKKAEKVASGQWPVASESRNPSLPTTHFPLFTVKTPTAIVTDLGTEFGIEVDGQGNTTSHVYRGSVKLELASSDGVQGVPPRILHANESARVKKNDDGKTSAIISITVDPASFVRANQLPQIHEERQMKPFQQWKAYSEELRKDPSLLAYYDFQKIKESPIVLRNVAANDDRSLDGVIKNAAWTKGRMAGKHALQFDEPDAHVQIKLPQTVDDLTLAAWVYVQSFDNRINSLLIGEGWFQPGQVAWQLWSDGRVQFDALRGELFSVPIFDRAQCRYRWAHLATAYDHAGPCVRFYFDGQMVNEVTTQEHAPICIGPAWIGHWNNKGLMAAGNGDDRRHFHGRIDELMIFGRPLSSDEIHRIFEAGKPVSTDDTIVHSDNK